jgi:16S rRNA (cytosine1402-N4)-methyltransferase
VIIDGTVGAGGHAAALLGSRRAGWAAAGASTRTRAPWPWRGSVWLFRGGVRLVHACSTGWRSLTAEAGIDAADAILLDLGVSSMHLDDPARGFSFLRVGPLDMRMNPDGDGPSAEESGNTWPESELADLIFRYGEDRLARSIARRIVQARPLASTRALAESIEAAVPMRLREKIHPATRTFQALRIAVNDELGALERVLPQAIGLLKPGGRLGVISFHSLEDRIVKQVFRDESTDCLCPPEQPVCTCGHRASLRLITRKPVTAEAAEVALNPRSRERQAARGPRKNRTRMNGIRVSDKTLGRLIGIGAALGVAALVVGMLARLLSLGDWPRTWDDSFMFVRYADNLRLRGALAWNPGAAPAYGLTSVLYVAVVLPVRLVVSSPVLAIMLSSAISGAAALILLLALLRNHASTSDPVARAAGVALVIGTLAAAREMILAHALSGMDTLFAMAYLTAYFLLVRGPAARPTRGWIIAAGVWGGLAYFVRPDLLLFSALIPLAMLILGSQRRAAIVLLLVSAGVVGVELLLARLAFGTWLPLPFYLKSAGNIYGPYSRSVRPADMEELQRFLVRIGR